MKILSVSDFYPPVLGGMERHVQTLAREMVQRGHSVAVVALEREGSPREEIDQGVRVYRVGSFSRALKPFYMSPARPFHPTLPDPGAMVALRRILQRERPEVIHGRGWIIYSLLALRAAAETATVVTLHDYGLICPKKSYLFAGETCTGPGYVKCVRCAGSEMGGPKALGLTSGLRVSHLLHTRVDRYIALNREMAAAVSTKLGTRGRPVHVVPSMIPDEAAEIGTFGERPAFVPSGRYLLYVGGAHRAKGLDVLLAAYASLSSPPPLVAILTPPVRHAPRLPAGVSVVEGASHDSVMAAWANCEAGVVPSVWPEPFGQVAVEAMACGKPVVASATGGLKDIVVPGETGLLVPAGDVGALRAALARLIDDPELRRRMGAAGQVRAAEFLARHVAAKVEDVYRDAIRDRRLRRDSRIPS